MRGLTKSICDWLKYVSLDFRVYKMWSKLQGLSQVSRLSTKILKDTIFPRLTFRGHNLNPRDRTREKISFCEIFAKGTHEGGMCKFMIKHMMAKSTAESVLITAESCTYHVPISIFLKQWCFYHASITLSSRVPT